LITSQITDPSIPLFPCSNSILDLDLDIDNLPTIASKQQGLHPILINGIVQINNRHNKDKANLQSKAMGGMSYPSQSNVTTGLPPYLHKVSSPRNITDVRPRTDSGVIVIGKIKIQNNQMVLVASITKNSYQSLMLNW
jgi:hypothetical protein